MTHSTFVRVVLVFVAVLAAAAVPPGVSALAVTASDETADPTPLAAQPSNTTLTVAVANDSGRVPRDVVTVTGTSNREDETTIFVELVAENGSVVTSAEGEVDGRTNSWNATLDLRDVPLGTYTLRADDGDVADQMTVEVVEAVETPTEAPTATPTLTPTATSSPTPSPTPTATPSPTPTATTPTRTPGFGSLVALVALTVAALAWCRR